MQAPIVANPAVQRSACLIRWSGMPFRAVHAAQIAC
jgi:hypothetical protein